MMTTRDRWLTRIANVKESGNIPIIAEIKASSPSAGQLLGNRSLNDIVHAYEAGGAACISVVTGRWFGGNLAMLNEVAKLTSLPLLRKDMIVNLDQIKMSVDHGANAILLTKQILQPSHLAKMIDLCITEGATPFVEVATREEIADLPVDDRIIVGIANRDISRKETDIESGLKSISLIGARSPHAGAVISASGISTPAEAFQLYCAGFDGLLVGTSLLQASDPIVALQDLTTARHLGRRH